MAFFLASSTVSILSLTTSTVRLKRKIQITSSHWNKWPNIPYNRMLIPWKFILCFSVSLPNEAILFRNSKFQQYLTAPDIFSPQSVWTLRTNKSSKLPRRRWILTSSAKFRRLLLSLHFYPRLIDIHPGSARRCIIPRAENGAKITLETKFVPSILNNKAARRSLESDEQWTPIYLCNGELINAVCQPCYD